MKKQLCGAVILSLCCCFPVFGNDALLRQEYQGQPGEISSFGQSKQGQFQENEKILCAGTQALEQIASVIAREMEKEPSSISFTQEVLSVSLGQSHAELKEEARILAANTPPAPEQPKNRWGITLTSEEFDLLARIVMLEAGGESPLGQQAVAEVILNRMVSPYYGGSLEYVLSTKGQFTTWKKRYSAQAAPTPQVIASVNAVLQGETNILPFQTLYFSRKPQNRRIQIQIGRHTFCNQ